MLKRIIPILFLIAAPLAAETKVLAFAGSTREDSYNKKLVQEAAAIARKSGAKVTYIDLRDYPLPLYDGDAEANEGMPANAKLIRQMMVDSDRIIIASPEYNGSLSAVLKNVIDWASRSDGAYFKDSYSGKKFAIMSASPGGGGGATGLKHLREILTRLKGDVIPLQVSVPKAHGEFSSDGQLKNAKLKEDLAKEMQQLIN
jgi:chromate reductase